MNSFGFPPWFPLVFFSGFLQDFFRVPRKSSRIPLGIPLHFLREFLLSSSQNSFVAPIFFKIIQVSYRTSFGFYLAIPTDFFQRVNSSSFSWKVPLELYLEFLRIFSIVSPGIYPGKFLRSQRSMSASGDPSVRPAEFLKEILRSSSKNSFRVSLGFSPEFTQEFFRNSERTKKSLQSFFGNFFRVPLQNFLQERLQSSSRKCSGVPPGILLNILRIRTL